MNVLELEGVSRQFGGLRAVDGVTLSIGTGITALIGPNGAGKTTLFNLMSGLLPVSSGRIRFRGQDITGLPAHRRAKLGMARTLQIKQVFAGLTVLENTWIAARQRHRPLDPFRRASDDRATRAAAEAALETMGLEAMAGRQAGSLAYGDIALLEIAMALATQPALLLLDEPVCGMSPSETERTVARIRAVSATTDVVIVEHDMDVVFGLADRVVVLAEGRVLADGPPAVIAREPAVREAYLGEDEEAA
ncbi:ABC transporter ATP-binding protein [Sabulicella glaciei]|uniref:ABC transporter ATP-binding protein n=1 Tax=Sabulicella glaciei TaxID=2984948 RepID=A0ABT3NZ16_9PROT|nr:ABC transporter ATP-binding protein [Roseococcus sp. MDT2-1-1]MCW8087400.1 ABC transporter ATP-binding protein [Roseococcus sp. MDT2-1-1]